MEDKVSGEEARLKERREGFTKDPALCRAQKGGEYQVKIAALFVVSAMKRRNLRYNLSVEDKSAGKFDDVVFKVYEEKKKKSIRWSLQAKHKEEGTRITFNDLLFDQKGDFYLRKYFQSFLEIRRSQGSRVADVERYIIYTPAALDFHSSEKEEDLQKITSGNNSLIFKKVAEDYDLLDGSENSLFELQPNDFIRERLGNSTEVDTFLKHLRFAVGQPNASQLDDILEEKLKEANTGIQLRKLKDYLCTFLGKWFKEYQIKGNYFTEMDVAMITLEIFSNTLKEKLMLNSVTFSEYDDLDRLFRDSESVVYTVPCSLKLCCTKFLTYPKNSTELFLLQFQDLMNVNNVVFPFLPLDGRTVIIVVVEEGDNIEEEKQSLESLIGRMKTQSDSKLIFILSDESLTDALELMKVLSWEDGMYSVTGLSSETQILLMEKEITLQGNSVPFKEICRNKCPPLSLPHIELLLSGPDVVIGKQVPTTEASVSSFVPRIFYLECLLREDCLDKLQDDEYVVITSKDNNHQSLFHRYKGKNNIFFLTREKKWEAFNELRVTHPGKNVHLIESSIERGRQYFQWLASHGSLGTLKKYTETSVKFYLEQIDQRPISVIAAEPGMGKTTQLLHIAEEEKKLHKDRWVVNVCLKDVACKLLSLNPEDNISHMSKRISEIFLGDECSFSRLLFQHSLEETGKFILLLDGYDEIGSQEEREKVLLVLRKLKENSRGQVIITTRLHFKEELEEATSTFAYRLEPLEETEQEKLLADIWIKNLDVSSDEEKSERVHVYAQELVWDFSQKIDERMGSVIGIPMQVTLLAEVFEESCKIYCKNLYTADASVEFPFINLLLLYSTFENIKCDKFIKSDVNSVPWFQKNLVEMVSEEHRSVCTEKALDTLLRYTSLRCDCCLRVLSKSRLLQEQGILRIGILHKSEGANLSLIHRSFAEYFYALHLAQIITKGRHCFKFEKLLQIEFYSKEYELIRLFVESALAKSGIHIAALTNDVYALGEELENGAEINERDALGRTPCHLEAAYKCEEAFELLISRGCDIQAKDNMAKLTPCELALKVHDKDYWFLSCLYKKGRAKEYNINFGDSRTNAGRHLDNLLPIIVDNGDVDTIRFILKSDDLHFSVVQVAFPPNWKQTMSIAQSQVACLQLIVEFVLRKRAFISLKIMLSGGNHEHIKSVFSAIVDSMNKRKDSLMKVVLFALFSEYDDLMAIAFDKISEITKDFPSFILKPFESRETLVHFAASYDLDEAVRRVFSRLQEEGAYIFQVLFPKNIKKESLIHLAARNSNFGLLRFFIDFIRENKGNVALYLSQQDSKGRTPLHCAVCFLRLESIKLIVAEIKSEQTPIFEAPLLTSAECGEKGAFFDFLFERIMAHGNNLLASIMRWDSSKRNCLDYFKENHDHETMPSHRKIDCICALEWVKKEMEKEIQKVFQATSTTYEVNYFMDYLLLKSKPEDKPQNKSTFFGTLFNWFS